NAEENVRANGVEEIVSVIEGDAHVLLPLLAPVDLVVANIISSVLTMLLPTIRGALAPGGRAILSGILDAERDEMLGVISSNSFAIRDEDMEDVWWSVTISIQ
ncbi:MAG TPA: 50S ribosomal protein L11 methyltransferase, partial [Gemmatimonadaceae bacterium]|nr:50S ribosomal protein L11 methyltransferase [Gemmatimonadaceae bacterium]